MPGRISQKFANLERQPAQTFYVDAHFTGFCKTNLNMAVIRPFRALRPRADLCKAVASVPYDVINVPEARALAEGNPWSFLHIIRPEIDLPVGTDEHDDRVYAQGAENLSRWAQSAGSLQDAEPALYAYRLRMGAHSQTGIYGLVSVDEYDRGRILKHENTRPPKVKDRVRHIAGQRAHAEPVNLAFPDDRDVSSILAATQRQAPLYDFTAPDGVQHTVWRVQESAALSDAFGHVPALYVADGHHRCEAASNVWQSTRIPASLCFPAVCFPVSEVAIMAYNRIVEIGDTAGFVDRVSEHCAVRRASAQDVPDTRGDVCLYAEGAWHTVTLPETGRRTVADTLDVARLGEFILEPLLGIADQRTDPRLSFVGGVRGTNELVERVNQRPDTVAFSMYPTSIQELLAVSDAGLLMPPKSTWFEPKLRSGLLVHLFD